MIYTALYIIRLVNRFEFELNIDIMLQYIDNIQYYYIVL